MVSASITSTQTGCCKSSPSSRSVRRTSASIRTSICRGIFFCVSQQKEGNAIQSVGGAGIYLRNNRASEYFDISLKKSLKGWHGGWFYLDNAAPGQPSFSDEPAQVLDTWGARLTDEEEEELDPLFRRIEELQEDVLNGVKLAATFIKRRIHPLRLRPRLLCNF